MSKTSASVNVSEVMNDRGTNPQAEVKGLRLNVKPVRFMASVKKGGSFKTISLAYQTIRIENDTMSQQYGFPVGTVVAVNAYLPVKKANKEQIARAVRNWREAQDAKKNKTEGDGTLNVDDIDADDDE